MVKTKDNRGGARPNTGPKPTHKEYSDEFKSKILKAINKRGKKLNTTLYDSFAEMLFDSKTQDTVRASLFKIVSEMMVVKKSEIEVSDVKEVIMLPPVKEVPKVKEAVIEH